MRLAETQMDRASHGPRPDLPHGEGALHPPRGPGGALCWNKEDLR